MPSAHAQQYAVADTGAFSVYGSSGAGVNSAGQVTGYSYTSSYTYAFLFSGGVLTDLSTLGGSNSYGQAINTAGQVAGYADTVSGDTHGFLYSGGAMTDIGTLGGASSDGLSVNNAGQIAGFSFLPAGLERAFLYSNGVMNNLGTLGGTASGAASINNSGQVVGSSYTGAVDPNNIPLYHAFIYDTSRGMVDLNTLIDPASGWTLTDARSISDNGNIIGYGFHSGSQRAFLLKLMPLQPVSLVFSPNPVTVGQATTATVTLSGPAPAGGALVHLTQGGADAGSNTVNEGQTRASYTLAFAANAATGMTLFTAAYNGVTVLASLSVVPIIIVPMSLVFSPNPVTANQATTGTVTLSAPAPAGGQAVKITRDGNSLLTVTVAEGQTTGTFTRTFYNGSGGSTLQMAASCNSVSVTTLLPVTAVTVTPTALSFTPNPVGPGAAATGTVTLSDVASFAGQTVTLTLNGTDAGKTFVNPGINNGVFSLTFPASLAGQTVSVTASCGGVTVTTSATVKPLAPVLSALAPRLRRRAGLT